MRTIAPIGKQKDVLGLKATEHSIILETAGSGKITIAMLRAKRNQET